MQSGCISCSCSCASIPALILVLSLRGGPHYESSAVVYIQPSKTKSISELTAASNDPNLYDSFMEQQLQTVLREDTLELGLQQSRMRGKDLWSLPGESLQSAAGRLHGQLKVERQMGSYQVAISLIGTNPVAVAQIVNDVVDAYIKTERADELAQSNAQLSALMTEKVTVGVELASDQKALNDLSADLGGADPTGHDSDPYDSQLKELQTQLLSAQTAHAVAQARLASIEGKGSALLDAATDERMAPDPAIAALKETISKQRATLAIEMAELKPSNPLYTQDKNELTKLDQTLESLSSDLHKKTRVILESELKLDAARTGDIEDRLNQQLKQLMATASAATPRLQRGASLTADVLRLESRLAEVENGISALELENHSSGMVHMVLPATVPQEPMKSKRALLSIVALPFAVAFGIFAAFLRQRLDPNIYTGDDVTAVLQFPPMAVLPKARDVAPRVLDELMLRLVGGVDQAHAVGGAQTFLFTAASSATEISGLVGSLALKMDRLGYRTMVLNASDVLQSLSSDDDVEPRLRNEARNGVSNQTRLARPGGESRAADKLARLRQHADLLFIEGVPLLSSVETEFVARLADVTVLVAGSGQTKRKELRDALALTRRLNVRGIASVLQDLDLRYADAEL